MSKPTQGEVIFDAPLELPGKESGGLYVDRPFYYDFMNIRMVGKYYSDFFEDLMKKFQELKEKWDYLREMKIRELSTGMMAKLKVIATLSRKALLYMLDEPLTTESISKREMKSLM